MVHLATGGDIEVARDILGEVAETLDLSVPIPRDYAQYIAGAFRRILGGTDAALALGIRTKQAGRPRGRVTHNAVALAAAYWLLVRSGRRPGHANDLVANETGADRRTIQRAARACSSFQDRELFDEKTLRAIVLRHFALSKILAI
jgi:hypothetical protein